MSLTKEAALPATASSTLRRGGGVNPHSRLVDAFGQCAARRPPAQSQILLKHAQRRLHVERGGGGGRSWRRNVRNLATTKSLSATRASGQNLGTCPKFLESCSTQKVWSSFRVSAGAGSANIQSKSTDLIRCWPKSRRIWPKLVDFGRPEWGKLSGGSVDQVSSNVG